MFFEEEKAFPIPRWIQKGALTKKMYEPVFWTKKEERKIEVIQNAKALINLTDMNYPKEIIRLEEAYQDAIEAGNIKEQKEIDAMLQARNKEYFFLRDTFSNYFDLTFAGVDYDERYREDTYPLRNYKTGKTVAVFDKKVRLYYKGERKKTDKRFRMQSQIEEEGRSSDYTVIDSLFTHYLKFERAIKNGVTIDTLDNYNEFLMIRNQIKALHAVVYYANQVEEKHREVIEDYNNSNQLSREEYITLSNKEDALYQEQLNKIKYNWDVIKYNLLKALDKKQVLDLSFVKEEPVEDEFLKEIRKDETLKSKEFYKKAMQPITQMKEYIVTSQKEEVEEETTTTL